MLDYERDLWAKGYRNVGGCDEAGRGPLAGPLVVACVVLDPEVSIEGINDSKKLSKAKREGLFDTIREQAKFYEIVTFSASEVDTLNVYQASKQGMLKACERIGTIDYMLTDAIPINHAPVPVRSIVKGDQKSASIAAASILAKVTRDRYMEEIAKKYPVYGFERHKGYPTKGHLAALNRDGTCQEHRKSFGPVRAIIERQTQLKL